MTPLTDAITFALFLTFITSCSATPRPAGLGLEQPRQFLASITFYGAGPGPPSFFQQFPTDDGVHGINNTLSVSQISSPGGAACTFFGVDGSDTFLFGAQSVQVGPPQAQMSGVCDGD